MISSNLKYLREKHELTQEQFAEKIGVSRQTVAKWENGESLPDIERCTEISMLFDVSIDMLATCKIDENVEPETSSVKDKYVFGIVKVGERGQVVIPKHAREVYNIKPGDRLLALGDKRGMALANLKGLNTFHFGG
ncbi:MAG: helix-turn-helix domain-containing protein [Ruminococcus sp.]|nr:helix-turn-helix domain-containing protein [Ruminococcus sp.]